ncbi:hypothetical protein GQ457_08G031970 [Hibiscus cannabinus]
MAESLLAKLGDLNFTAEEQDAVVVVHESVAIPAEHFACSPWGVFFPPTHSMVVELLVSFVLSGRTIRDNVLKRGPWDFQKHWFVLEPADPACTIHDYAFRYMCILVRIHNIPLSLMTEALAHTLGACIGKVVMTDTRLEDGNMGEFLRVRVSLDTTKPLRRCVTLSRSNAKAVLCPLQYERIPIFCHGCGLIGHTVLQLSVARPRGRVSVVKDAKVPPLSPAPSVAYSPPASASAAAASVPAPAASDDTASVPVLATIGPAPAASEAAAFAVPLTAGRVTTGSAPMSAPPPRGKETADVDSEVPVGTSYVKSRRSGIIKFLCPTRDPCTNTENMRKS